MTVRKSRLNRNKPESSSVDEHVSKLELILEEQRQIKRLLFEIFVEKERQIVSHTSVTKNTIDSVEGKVDSPLGALGASACVGATAEDTETIEASADEKSGSSENLETQNIVAPLRKRVGRPKGKSKAIAKKTIADPLNQ